MSDKESSVSKEQEQEVNKQESSDSNKEVLQKENTRSEGSDSSSSSSSSEDNESSSSSSDESSESLKVGVPPKPIGVVIKPMIYLFACIGALSGLTFGYDIGGSGGTFIMPSFRAQMGWDENCMYLFSHRKDPANPDKVVQDLPEGDEMFLWGYDVDNPLEEVSALNSWEISNPVFQFVDSVDDGSNNSGPYDYKTYAHDYRTYSLSDVYPTDDDGNSLDPWYSGVEITPDFTCRDYFASHRIYDINYRQLLGEDSHYDADAKKNVVLDQTKTTMGYFKRYYNKKGYCDNVTNSGAYFLTDEGKSFLFSNNPNGDSKCAMSQRLTCDWNEVNDILQDWTKYSGSLTSDPIIKDTLGCNYETQYMQTEMAKNWNSFVLESVHHSEENAMAMYEKPCLHCCCDKVYEPGAKDPKETADMSYITLFETLGCAIGSLLSGYFADLLGRRFSLMFSCSIFILGALIQALTIQDYGIYILCTGRVIGGLGIGMMSMQATLYQSEIAPEEIRGLFVTMQQLMITTGIVIASLCNLGFQTVTWGWRLSYGGNMLIAMIMLVSLFFVPESPYYLYLIRRDEQKARFELEKLRSTDAEVSYEMYMMKEDLAELDKRGKMSLLDYPKELFSSEFRNNYRIATVCAMHVLQQMTGMNSIMFYGPKIATDIYGYAFGQFGGLLFNSVNFLATFICVYAIDRFGRIPLWISGTGCCMLGLLISAICSQVLDSNSDPDTGMSTLSTGAEEAIGAVTLVGICVFIIGFAYSWGPLSWVYGSEALNARTKALGMSLGIACNWCFTAVIGTVYPFMRESIGISASFWIFFGFCALGGVVVAFFIPETSGVPLEKMDELFKNTKIEFLGPKSKKQTF